jgi:hypothetical protein
MRYLSHKVRYLSHKVLPPIELSIHSIALDYPI